MSPSQRINAFLLLVAVALGVTGCASMKEYERTTTSVVSERVIEKPSHLPSVVDVDFTLDGSVLRLTGQQHEVCHRQRWRTVERRRLLVREPKDNWMLLEALGGLAGATAGSGVLAASRNASDEPRFNPDTGKEEASAQESMRVVGGLLITAGATSLVALLVDGFKARDRVIHRHRRDLRVSSRQVRCNSRPLAHTLVQYSIGGGVPRDLVTLGRRGRAEIDLLATLPTHEFEGAAPPEHLTLHLRTKAVAQVDMSGVAFLVSARALASIGKNASESELRDFIQRYGWSPHAKEALKRIDAIVARRVAAAWTGARAAGNVSAYVQFLERHPGTPHAPKARRLIVDRLLAQDRCEAAKTLLEAWEEAGAVRGVEVRDLWARVTAARRDEAEAAWQAAERSREPERLKEFLATYQRDIRAKGACRLLVELALERSGYGVAVDHVRACADMKVLTRSESKDQQNRIKEARRKAHSHAVARAKAAVARVGSCRSASKIHRRKIAVSAYQKLRGLRGRLSRSEIKRYELQVFTICRVNPTAAGR